MKIFLLLVKYYKLQKGILINLACLKTINYVYAIINNILIYG